MYTYKYIRQVHMSMSAYQESQSVYCNTFLTKIQKIVNWILLLKKIVIGNHLLEYLFQKGFPGGQR